MSDGEYMGRMMAYRRITTMYEPIFIPISILPRFYSITSISIQFPSFQFQFPAKRKPKTHLDFHSMYFVMRTDIYVRGAPVDIHVERGRLGIHFLVALNLYWKTSSVEKLRKQLTVLKRKRFGRDFDRARC